MLNFAGRLFLNDTSTPLPDVRFELFDVVSTHGWLAGGKTDANGHFQLQLSDATEALISAHSVQIRVFKGTVIVYQATLATVETGEPNNITVPLSAYDNAIPDETHLEQTAVNYSIVYGVVSSTKGLPLGGMAIRIFEAGFQVSAPVPIATTRTNPSGYYEAKIAVKQLAHPGTAQRTLYVEAQSAGSDTITKSGLLLINDDRIECNFLIGAGAVPTTEFTAMVNAIQSITGTASIAGITTEGNSSEANYLAKAAGIPYGVVLNIVTAYQYAADTGIAAKFFYALMRTTQGQDLISLIAHSQAGIIALITKAITDSVIDPTEGSEISAAAAAMGAVNVAKTKDAVIQTEEVDLGSTLTTAFGDQVLVDKFLNYATVFDGNDAQAFWAGFKASYTETDGKKLQKGLQLLAITGFQPKVANYLIGQLGETGTEDNLYQLATWSVNDWKAAINAVSTTEAPAVPKVVVSSGGIVQDIPTYAAKLKEIVQNLYPLTALNVKLNDSVEGRELIPDDKIVTIEGDDEETTFTTTTRDAVISYIEANPKFDLRFQSIYDIDAAHLTGGANLEKVQNALAPFQTLTRIVGAKPDAIAALITSGISSAQKITAISREAFVEQNSSVLGSPQNAGHAYAVAQQISTITASAGVSIVTNRENQAANPVLPSTYNSESAAPQLSTLFGSQEQCGCEYCMSVYSPVAYYVDILNFLKTHGATAYTELTRRRPDLPHIDLTCKNANTPLPYIDLVNELLEIIILKAVTATSGITPPESFQTIGIAAELAARPEHVIHTGSNAAHNRAYVDYPYYSYVYNNVLNNASYPDNLPFNLGLEEARVYLKHLGVSRYDAMNLYLSPDQSIVPIPTGITAINILTEYLGISKEAADIITDITGTATWKYYGFSATTSATIISIISPSDTSVTLSGTWINLLLGNVPNGGIDVLINQLKISYKELSQLVATRFLNPKTGGIRKVIIDSKPGAPGDTCVLKDLWLDVSSPFDTAAFFGRMHRFVRLWRATGMSIYALDQLLHSMILSGMSTIDIDTSSYSNVARTLILAGKLNTTPNRLSAWWSDIDTERYPDVNSEHKDTVASLYDQLFLSKSVLTPPDPTFGTFNSGGQPILTVIYRDHTAAIIAALGITEEELFALMDEHGISITATITLPALSWLFAAAAISKGLGMRVKDFIRFATLTYTVPTSTPTVFVSILSVAVGTATAQLDILDNMVARSAALASSGFTLDESLYLLRNDDPAGAFIPKEQTIQLFYEGLRKELKKIQSTDITTNKPAALANAIVQQFAAQFGISADIARLLLGTSVTITSGGTTVTTNFLVINRISGIHVPIDLLTAFIDAVFIDSSNDLSLDIIDVLDPVSGTPATPHPDWHLHELYYVYYRVAKIAFIVNRLKIKKAELESLNTNSLALGVTDLTKLPVKSGDLPLAFRPFMQLSRWLKLRDRIRLEQADFVSLTSGTLTKATWMALLLATTGWNATTFEEIVGGSGESIILPSGLIDAVFDNQATDPVFIAQVADIMDANERIGLVPSQIIKTLSSTIQLEDAHKILKAARSKKTDSEWLKIAKPLHDVLREKQRQALVSYVIANPGTQRWHNENDLYAYLLIDVEMTPCMKTSRIKQAISTVQLYIDRLIMNLEHVGGTSAGASVTISPATIAQWKSWRKWYRVWEANRKIFLYPENWIEPELRDDKSPFFKELETQLLQDEIKTGKVEQAYYEYLDKVDEVARLEPVTSYHELEPVAGRDIVHVVARTYAQPQHYFYRRLENNQWSAWERMNIEIKGDHLVLVVWNRRLHIYWLTFIEKSPTADEIATMKSEVLRRRGNALSYWIDKIDAALIADPNGERFKYWNILLNWSELKEGKWLAPKIAKDVMELKPYQIILNYRNQKDYNLSGTTGYSSKNTFDLLQYLTNKKEIKIHELFKNRIYFLPILSSDTRLVLNILFGGGLDEYNLSLHTFLCADSSTDPVVLRDGDSYYQFLAPSGTVTNKMKFYQSPLPAGAPGSTGKLSTDGYQWSTAVKTGRYIYAFDYLNIGGAPTTMPVHALDQVILNNTPYGPFRITARSDMMAGQNTNEIKPVADNFFYEDKYNNYFVRAVQSNAYDQITVTKQGDSLLSDLGGAYFLNYLSDTPGSDNTYVSAFESDTFLTGQPSAQNNAKYYFQTFYHPHIHKFIRALNKDGIDGLLSIGNQVKADALYFATNYLPTALVLNTARNPYPNNIVDFRFDAAYSIYNWELFFHIPMIVAQSLSANQQFEDAQKWYHYVFNPTSNTNDAGAITGSKQRFWKFRPFYEEAAGPVTTLADMIAHINNYADQILAWETHPFQPHVIARMRISAYMKNAVMKYLDNLIAWGDQLFRRDTIESINEATQLYILAANILGPRPQEVPARAVTGIYDFVELVATGTLDYFSNAQVKIESFIDPSGFPRGGGANSQETASVLKMMYFCLPQNDKMFGYWDTIADRLFKIRNCMNIEGVRQELPLFEPPIDPALLVRAAAAGVDINSILNEVSGAFQPHYRFSYMLQKANELVADVKSLGSAILSALEKKDAEHLALLRAGQEIDLLDKVTYIKESQINEAKSALEALQKTKENTTLRLQYYTSRPYMNAGEIRHLESVQEGMVLQIEQAVMEATASALAIIPQFHGQVLTAVGPSFGGQQLSTAMRAFSSLMGIRGIVNNTKGTLAATTAGYQRRQDDWTFQADSAKKELEQLDKQVIGAEIRISIAERELSNHLKQIENSQAVDEYMRQKFTNEELYNWMVSQIAAIYFQSYQIAYDLAAKVETCYNYELPLSIAKKPAGGFIKFGYWDSLRKGLLTGERIQYDLRKIEVSYMEENKRSLELTKHVSLVSLNPEALLGLRKDAWCEVEIPEWLFDLDYPGHYMRRIKSVSISIPCVAGPYTTVSCKLTLQNHRYRFATTGTTYKEATPAGSDTNRFVFSPPGNTQSVATSRAQNDSGMFELSFRDERYLPFEGAGAISSWKIELPAAYAQFDYNTISDVILHINYTAVDGGAILKTAAATYVTEKLTSLAADHGFMRLFSLRHEFANEWFAYASAFTSTPGPMTIKLHPGLFPLYSAGKKIGIAPVYIMLKPKGVLSGDYTLVISYKNNGIVQPSLVYNLYATSNYTLHIPLPPELLAIDGNTKIMKLVLKNASGPVNMDVLLDDLYLVTLNDLGAAIVTPAADDADWTAPVAPLVSSIPTTGLIGWWKADAGISSALNAVTSVNEVTMWADQSSSSVHNDLTSYATSLNPPFHATGGSNGTPYLSFDGARSLFISALGIPALTRDITTFLVLKNTNSSILSVIFELTTDINSYVNGLCIAVNDGTGNTVEVALQGDVGYNVSHMSIPYNTWVCMRVEGWKSKSSHEALPYINGITTATMAADSDNTNYFATGAPFYLGSRANSSLFTQADISEVIMYTGTMSSSDILIVETYLKAKYGL